MNDLLVHYKILVSGKVQGVGCRQQILCAAKLYQPLRGFVENLKDGNVLIEVQGTKSLVIKFLDRVRSALVKPVCVENLKIEEIRGREVTLRDFYIKR